MKSELVFPPLPSAPAVAKASKPQSVSKPVKNNLLLVSDRRMYCDAWKPVPRQTFVKDEHEGYYFNNVVECVQCARAQSLPDTPICGFCGYRILRHQC